MEEAVMQSRWIQRLNPACQTGASEEEELTKPNHVRTHFTKDFSSSSKRFHKPHHHTHPSLWHLNERTAKSSPSSNLKLVDPIGIKEQHPLSRAAFPMLREEHLCVPASESNDLCSKTGNFFSNQYTSCKTGSSLEGLVPCSNTTRTWDEGERKDEGKLRNLPAQQFQWLSTESASASGDSTFFKRSFLDPNLNKESGSARDLGDAPCKEKFAASELAHRIVHIRGSSPDGVIGTSISPAHMGASADADDRMRLTAPHIKHVYPSKLFKLRIDRPGVVFGDAESKIIEGQLGVAPKETSGTATSKQVKTGQNFGFLHFVGQSKTSNQCSDKVGVYNKVPGSRKQNAGFGTTGVVRPLVSKDLYDFQSFNTDSRWHDSLVAAHLLNPKEEMSTKMPPKRRASGDFTRPSFKKTNLDDHWVKLQKDSQPEKLVDTTYLKATPPLEHMTNKYHRFWTANIRKRDEKERLNFFRSPSLHIPVSANAQTIYSCDMLQQTQASLRSSFIPTKETDPRYNQGASADRVLLEGSLMSRILQEEDLQGGMKRLGSQIDKKEHKLYADGRTTEHSRMNQAWYQRWLVPGRIRPPSNAIALSGKTLSPSVVMDKELGSSPTMHPVVTSCKGKEVGCFDHNLIEPSRTSKLLKKGLARHHDSGFGAICRGSFPVYRSNVSLKGQYMAPSIEAMAIVGNTSGNLHTSSLQKRGSLSVWRCPSDKNSQERRHAKETVECNTDREDMDDRGFLAYKMR